ncbi:MAG: Uncharacterised protein [Acidimicrobiales bacterium AG-410-I20]|nr:MAG: Uncharacterised protein [Acidimicrobiales bacterium AG-410-I20]
MRTAAFLLGPLLCVLLRPVTSASVITAIRESANTKPFSRVPTITCPEEVEGSRCPVDR